MTDERGPAPAQAAQSPGRQLGRRRIEITIIAAFALGITLLLSAIRVPRIRAVISLVVNEVGLELQDDWEINDLPLRQLSTTNAKSLAVVGGLAAGPGNTAPDGPGGDLEIRGRSAVSAWQAWLSSEYLRLNVTVPAGAGTRLSVLDGTPGALRMTVDGGTTLASLDTGAELEVRCTSCVADPGPLGTGAMGGATAWTVRPARRTIHLNGAELPLMLGMHVDRGDDESMALLGGARLATRAVDFFRAGRGPEVSAVTGPGSIVFPGLEADPVPIGPGDFVVVSAHDPLSVHRLALGDAIEVELRGTVDELSVGTAGALRSQKPTLLAYLWGNKWLQAVLGAALTIGAAVSTVLYRFGLRSRWDR